VADDLRSDRRVEPTIDGTGRRVAVVCGRFNDRITHRLLDGTLPTLRSHGVADDDITVVWVPGSYEIPFAARRLADTGRYDVVVTLGAVVRGETGHYDFVAGECARGIQDVQLATGVPVIFGVLTTDSAEQALARSDPEGDNRGIDSALAALEMAELAERYPPHAT
jgi:6,7-dimethyl-8-ribityllumazine synthase